MTKNEHPDQDLYENAHLTISQWEQVIERAKNADKSDMHMYILRSWANQQSVSNASICAFREIVVEDITDRKTGSNAIGQISKFVRDVTGIPKATCYEWNSIKGEWTLGGFQSY
tara:strand:- start:44 stop:385 length:342 start_codon:yes stop_codon:yes gene_type:complete